jgi:hypothetical protein
MSQCDECCVYMLHICINLSIQAHTVCGVVGCQSYFMIGGLLPITSPWRQALWDSRSVFYFQLNTCDNSLHVTSSLTRGWVCHLQLLLALTSAIIFGSESVLSHIQDPQPGGSGPRIYIPQEQGGPVITSGTGFPFRCPLWPAGLWWRYSTLPPHGIHGGLSQMVSNVLP